MDIEILLILSALLFLGLLGLVIFKLMIVASKDPFPFRIKEYFFSRSEQEFLRLLNDSIDRQKFTIFPKVRLADFVEVTVSGADSQIAWNKIRAKHVDFLVWNVLESKIVFAIELDGRSHQSDTAIKSDTFKDKLYEKIGIKLLRIDTGSNFVEKVGEIKTLLSNKEEEKNDQNFM